jgi:hypothetical protein
MVTEDEIRQALHAGRVVPLRVPNPHGPLGLEQLAAAVARLQAGGEAADLPAHVRRPIDLPLATWEKLDHLAEASSRSTRTPVSAAELASAIIQQYVATAEP